MACIAQLEERWTVDPMVTGSKPATRLSMRYEIFVRSEYFSLLFLYKLR